MKEESIIQRLIDPEVKKQREQQQLERFKKLIDRCKKDKKQKTS
jgi:hypothetical protein